MFASSLAKQIAEASQADPSKLAEVLGAVAEADVSITAGKVTAAAADAVPAEWNQPGLQLAFVTPHATMYCLLPAGATFLPEWCRDAAATDAAKIKELAISVADVVLPASFTAESTGQLSDDLSGPFREPPPTAQLQYVPLQATAGDQTATLWLAWQVETAAPPAPGSGSPAARSSLPPYHSLDEGLKLLPPYARSLLKVQIPVRVKLATTRVPLKRVLEIGPGMILQFQKSCDDTLTLEAGGQEIAEGEAVKVGEKFGLRITSIKKPEERFWVLKGQKAERVK